VAVEVVSPGDETWEKLRFYATNQVDELVVVDPGTRSVDWRALRGGEYVEVARSRLIDLDGARLAALIDWPPGGS